MMAGCLNYLRRAALPSSARRGFVLHRIGNTREFSSPSLRQNKNATVEPYHPRKTEQTLSFVQHGREQAQITSRIQAAVAKKSWIEVMDTFRSVPDPNTIVYSAIINAAANLRRYEEGLIIYEEMRARQVAENVGVHSAVLKILGAQGRLADAKTFYEGVFAYSPDEVRASPSALIGVLNAAAINGDVTAIQDELALAEQRGVLLNRGAYGCLIKACRQAVKPQQALEVLETMRERHMLPTILEYTQALGACVKDIKHRQDAIAAEHFLATLLEMMARDGIKANEYFLEEQVALILGVDRLREVRAVLQKNGSFLTEASAAKASKLIDDASASGMRISQALRTTQTCLRQVM
eukprot:TRINITY_DN70947_c0_g1_i1.p1 TRINITY_DN70947_c0_g1~~TRINITY_DN70947_c0_g1_i1.p1  ORF type:complete len:352 (-),score=39.01 TRINITY_DN70947_c0_g1_i1:72-1127(-)